MTSPDFASDDVIDALDSLYCHNVIVALWADAASSPPWPDNDGRPPGHRAGRGKLAVARTAPPLLISRTPTSEPVSVCPGLPQEP